ncbi:hypothetical protein EYF80_025418 [Liparis tanakae]|uniref:Uncharacterized protein n=1 Tax=Liparis tanakae TaxID=230148 RepID=A0A4Z2HET2_9TELE|nr:hypothetical protein EYF80_025418 [Liparis tanakae]
MRDTAWYIWFGEPVAFTVRYRISLRMSVQLFILLSWRERRKQERKQKPWTETQAADDNW